MKRLWNLFSVVAVVNLAVVVAMVGWLMASGRLTRDSMDLIRAALAAPDNGQIALTASTAPAEDVRDITPVGLQLNAADRLAQQHALSLRRLREESEQLARRLSNDESELKAREQAFAVERQQWEEATAGARDQASAEQFRKAVKTLESVPPKQAKEWILGLVAAGNVEQAVAYLDAMAPFKSASVFKAFKGEEENAVATNLLERLRLRTPTSGGSSQAMDAPTDAPGTRNPASDARTGPLVPPSRGASGSQPVANAGAAIDAPTSARR